VLAALLGSLTASSAASAGNSAAPAGRGLAQIHAACPAPLPGHMACFALVRSPVAAGTPASAGAVPYVVDSGASSPGPAGGLTPAQLAGAYGYDPSAGGSGQTVGIVDAYDDPNIEQDLGTFDAHYGLPPCTTANRCFEKVGQTGSASLLAPADTTGWSEETSLDVDAVHSVCPNCRILLVEANSSSGTDLATAVNEAVALGATEVSNSYGGPELGISSFEQNAYSHPGVAITASSGDDGYYGWTSVNDGIRGPEMPEAPASLPSVVAVGGTTLNLSSSGTRASETVWNGNGPGDDIGASHAGLGATGGGCSRLFTAEPWQRDVAGYSATGCAGARLVSDVSADADPATGFDIYDSYKCGSACDFRRVDGGWATFGGTSLSAQLIGALYGLAGGSGGVKDAALTLYAEAAEASSSYDVTAGGNGFCGGESGALCGFPNSARDELVDCEGTTACDAAPGFDGPSGVGTPNGLGLFKALRPTAVITPPASPAAGIAAPFGAAASSDPYPGGSISSYTWSWGDGSANSGGPSPVHTYAAAGTYTVTLTVTDDYGLTASSSTSVSVAAASGPSASAVAGEEEGAPAAVPDAKLASTALAASASGSVAIKVSCPAGESSCSGTVTLRTLDAVSASAPRAAKAKKAILTLARGSFNIAGGKTKTITLHLSAKARALLSRSHVLRVRATIVAHDPSGAAHTTEAVVTLRAPKAKHGRG